MNYCNINAGLKTVKASVMNIIKPVNNFCDINAGLKTAKKSIMDVVKPGINDIVVPLLSVLIGGFLIFFIAGAVNRHRGGEEYHDKIISIIVCIIALALVISWPKWGWTMVGA